MMTRTTQASFFFFALLALLAAVVAESGSSRHHRRHHSIHVQTRVPRHGEGGGGRFELAARARSWPCCDSCGGCTKSIPPLCRCLDASPRGCHPACRDCVKSSLSVDPPVYQCMDRLPNFCRRRCTAASAAAR